MIDSTSTQSPLGPRYIGRDIISRRTARLCGIFEDRQVVVYAARSCIDQQDQMCRRSGLEPERWGSHRPTLSARFSCGRRASCLSVDVGPCTTLYDLGRWHESRGPARTRLARRDDASPKRQPYAQDHSRSSCPAVHSTLNPSHLLPSPHWILLPQI